MESQFHCSHFHLLFNTTTITKFTIPFFLIRSPFHISNTSISNQTPPRKVVSEEEIGEIDDGERRGWDGGYQRRQIDSRYRVSNEPVIGEEARLSSFPK